MVTYSDLTTIISNERLQMSEANREHFDIEARDHLEQFQLFPGDAPQIHRSLLHRVYLHKTRNMFRVPPMLFPRDGESDSDHMRRENEAWGLYPASTVSEPGKDDKSPQRSILAASSSNHEQHETAQPELF